MNTLRTIASANPTIVKLVSFVAIYMACNLSGMFALEHLAKFMVLTLCWHIANRVGGCLKFIAYPILTIALVWWGLTGGIGLALDVLIQVLF